MSKSNEVSQSSFKNQVLCSDAIPSLLTHTLQGNKYKEKLKGVKLNMSEHNSSRKAGKQNYYAYI